MLLLSSTPPLPKKAVKNINFLFCSLSPSFHSHSIHITLRTGMSSKEFVAVQQPSISVTEDIESLAISLPVSSSRTDAPTSPDSGTASSFRAAATTIGTPAIPTNDIPQAFKNGPKLDPERNWRRMMCEKPGCNRKSIENFYFSTFHCHVHGYMIPDQWRLDCVFKDCKNSSYQFLHPEDNDRTFHCRPHRLNNKSVIFSTRLRVQSHDFVLEAGDLIIPFISGYDFDSKLRGSTNGCASIFLIRFINHAFISHRDGILFLIL